MCRQVWFPPNAGREYVNLLKYLTHLKDLGGGHGMGVGFGPNDEEGDWTVRRGLDLTPEGCARLLVDRPEKHWGAYHCRRASTGLSTSNISCHPHTAEGRNQVVLTHNGTWMGWREAALGLGKPGLTSDSAVLAELIAAHGWFMVAANIDQTIMAAVKDEDSRFWRLRAHVGHAPLLALYGGAIATSAMLTGHHDYQPRAKLDKGSHLLSDVRTSPLTVGSLVSEDAHDRAQAIRDEANARLDSIFHGHHAGHTVPATGTSTTTSSGSGYTVRDKRASGSGVCEVRRGGKKWRKEGGNVVSISGTEITSTTATTPMTTTSSTTSTSSRSPAEAPVSPVVKDDGFFILAKNGNWRWRPTTRLARTILALTGLTPKEVTVTPIKAEATDANEGELDIPVTLDDQNPTGNKPTCQA